MNSCPSCKELAEEIRELESEVEKLRKVEQELHDSQESYRIHFTLADDVIYSLDSRFMVLSVSPNVEKMLGYTPEELIGRPFHELNVLAEEYLNRAFNDVHSVLRKKRVDSTIYEFITKDGKRRFGEVSGVPFIRNGKAVAVISVARDITERLEMERSLRESEGRFRAVFDSAKDCIFIKDTNLAYTFVNPCMRELFGLSSEEMIGKKDRDLFGEADGREINRVDMRVLAGEIVEEEHTRTVNGDRMTFHVIKVPMRDGSGTVMGLCGIARNITERKRFEEALRDKERQLEMQAKNLEEVNTALKVLLDHREEEKRKMQEDIVSKARKLLFPYMEKLERSGIDDDGKIFLSIIRSNLQELISSNVSASGRQYRHLTPMEIQVADLIKQGKTSKEMASMLNISEHAISFHRSNIRKKLGLLHTKTNLGVYLLSDEPA